MAAEPAARAFSVAFAVLAAVAFLQGERQFCCDASQYWELSDSLTRQEGLFLLDIGDTGLRGYTLPLIYYLARGFAGIFTDGGLQVVMVFNAALFALIGAVLVPKLARVTWPDLHWGVGRRLAVCAPLLLLWRGYLSYPLSDFPALAAALLALIAASSPQRPVRMAIAGAMAGLAINMRPAYLLLVPALLLFVALDWREQTRGRNTRLKPAVCMTLFVIGLALVSLPQSLSQHRSSGSYSPVPGGGRLASIQYERGIELQRYETYVGGTPDQAMMLYIDSHTSEIIASRDTAEPMSTSEYLQIVADHPLTMAGVFLRHLVNGLDQRYTTPYVERIGGGLNGATRFAGFALAFLALVRVAWPRARRALGPARWRYPLALLALAAPALTTAVETRFMLPLFALCSVLVFAPGWVNPVQREEKRWTRRYRASALLAGAAILFCTLVSVIVSGATDNLQLG